MKKFLSSLLALTMILSLVIVPAQANNDPTVTGATVSGKSDLTLNETTEYSVSLAGAKAGDVDISNGTGVTYKWTVSDALEITGDSANKDTQAKVSVKAKSATTASSKASVTCTITYTPSEGSSISGSAQKTGITVTDPQAAFEAAVKQATVTFKGRTYSFNNSTSVTIDKFSADSETLSAEDLRLNVTGYNSAVITKNGDNWAVKSSSAADALSVSVTVDYTPVTGQTLSISGTGVTASGDNYAATVYSGQSLKLTASYARTGSKSVGYAWSSAPAGATLNNTDSQTSTFIAPDVNANTIYTVTCIAKEGSSESIRKTVTITVKPDPYSPSRNGEDATKTIATNNSASCTIAAPVLKSTNDTVYYQSSNTANFDITWAVKSAVTSSTRLQRTPTAALL